MVSGIDGERAARELGQLEGTVTLALHEGPAPSALGAALAEAAGVAVTASRGAVTVGPRGGAKPPAVPALSIARGDGPARIFYLVAPTGGEAGPFLDALVAVALGTRDGPLARLLASLGDEVELVVLVGPGCHHCPEAVRQAVALVAASPKLRLSVVDATVFPELAASHGARSVPTTLLPGGLAMTGVVPASRLAEALAELGEPSHAGRLLAAHLEAGRFDEAGRLLAAGPALEAFGEAWRRSVFEGRLALMLGAEAALERSPRALDPLVPALVAALEAEDGALRGDTADLLGKIGDPRAVPPLARLLEDPNPDVAEIVAEVLETLRRLQS